MLDLDGNENYSGGNNDGYGNNNYNNGYNNNSYGSNNYNNGYNNNSYGNNNYNNGYNNNNYGSNNYNNGYNNNNYGNNNYNNGYNNNSYNSSSTSLSSTTSGSSGGSSFLIVIFAIAAVLFLFAIIGTEMGSIKNCKETTRGYVVDVTQTKQRVHRKNNNHSGVRYKYYYRAKIAYEVDGEQFVLDVPKTKCQFRNGESDIVHYNKNDPSESYSEKYMDRKKTDAVFTVGLIVVCGFISLFKKKTTGRI